MEIINIIRKFQNYNVFIVYLVFARIKDTCNLVVS